MLTTAVFSIRNLWNQPRCLSTDNTLGKANIAHTHDIHKGLIGEQSCVICQEIDANEDHHVKQIECDSERKNVFSSIERLDFSINR